MKPIKKLVVGEKYKDRDGNEKTKWIRLGTLFTNEADQPVIKLDSLPVNFDGWIRAYDFDDDKKQKDTVLTDISDEPVDLNSIPF